jgi:hypothetical protein
MKPTHLLFFVCLLCVSNATNKLFGMQPDISPLLEEASTKEAALILAAEEGDLDSVISYIKAGANPDFVSPETNLTALGSACRNFSKTYKVLQKGTAEFGSTLKKFEKLRDVIGFLAEHTGPPANSKLAEHTGPPANSKWETKYRIKAIKILGERIFFERKDRCFWQNWCLCCQSDDNTEPLMQLERGLLLLAKQKMQYAKETKS